jgi:hypothetical protein
MAKKKASRTSKSKPRELFPVRTCAHGKQAEALLGKGMERPAAAGLFDGLCEIPPAEEFPGDLGLHPVIEGVAHLAKAMEIVSWCKSRLKGVQGWVEAVHARANQHVAQHSQLVIGGESIGIDHYSNRVEKAAREFALANREKVFAAGQTVKLPAGTLQLKGTPASVQPVDPEQKADELVDAIVEQLEATEALASLRAQLSPWIKVEVSIDRASIQAAASALSISAEQLAELGLQIAKGQQVYVKPLISDQQQVVGTAA